MKVPVSVLIPTRNEEANLAKCLASVVWADDVWVVDSASTDRTAEIARAAGAQVVAFCWDGRGPRKKNWALGRLPFRHPWLLLLDADEEATPALAEEVARRLAAGPAENGFLVRYHYYFLGRWLRHGDPLWKLALVRHACARFESIAVPEVTGYDVELHEWPRVPGRLGRLRAPLLHRDAENLRHFFDRHNVYSDWEARLAVQYAARDRSGEIPPRLAGTPVERRRWLKRLFLRLPGRSWAFFLYSYFLRGGFLDGRAGFHYAALKAIYWYQVGLKALELEQSARARPQIVEAESGARRGTGPARDEREAQLHFYAEAVDPEEEITRPRGYPRPVRYLLEGKLGAALELLRRTGARDGAAFPAGTTALVVCAGSGMESEYLARTGLRVTALDISSDAVRRAGERAGRFDVAFERLTGDAERLPFADGAFDVVFVHDGLHHLADPYRGVAEMLRVARCAVVIAEPADAALTRLAIRLGISGRCEDAGNFVFRLDPARLAHIFRNAGAAGWAMRRDLVYYQPWTFGLYRWLNREPMFSLFRFGFRAINLLVGRWGNSLKAVAVKPAATASPTLPPERPHAAVAVAAAGAESTVPAEAAHGSATRSGS
jgi:glycosyltransferase involved in cell wall biosynthesis/SAM-dependent methyltransferase